MQVGRRRAARNPAAAPARSDYLAVTLSQSKRFFFLDLKKRGNRLR